MLINFTQKTLFLRLRVIRIVFSILIFCPFISAHAKTFELQELWSPYFKYLTVDSGLSQSLAKKIVQDESEHIWVVTPAGIDRFNGYEFQSIPFKKTSLQSPQTQIVGLLVDKNQHIIAITKQGYVFVYQKASQSFEAFFTPVDDLRIVTAETLANNQLLLYGKNGFLLLDMSKDRPFTQEKPATSLNTMKNIHFFLNERNIILWVSTSDGGLYSFNQLTGETVVHLSPGKNNNPLIISLAMPKGIFAASSAGNLYRIESPESGLQTVPLLKIKDVVLKRINAIQQTSERYLWVATQGEGLFRFDLDNFSFKQYKAINNVQGSLSSNNVYALFFDLQDQLWASASNGINYSKVEKPRFFQLGGNHPYSPNIGMKSVYGVAQDNSENLWLGSHDAGISQLIKADSHTQTLQFNNYLDDQFISSMAIDENQIVWVGLAESMVWIDSKTNQIIPVSSEWSKISRSGVSAIYIHNRDKFVISDNNQFYYQSDQSEVFSFPNPLKTVHYNYISIAGPLEDSYWIGSLSSGQILQFNRKTHEFIIHEIINRDNHPVTGIISLWVSPTDELWIGTDGEGVVRKHLSSSNISWLDSHNGLTDDHVYSIIGDHKGYVWITGNKGINRYSPDKKIMQHFTVKDGIQSNEFNTHSAFRTKDGLLLFGGINGATIIDENTIVSNLHIPKTYIQQSSLFTQQGMRQLSLNSDSSLGSLDYRSNSIQFKIGAVDLLNPEGNTYSYRLMGSNEDWINLGNNRTISFLNLPSGNYQLEVTSCNSEQTCNLAPVIAKFIISPPPWLSIWAYLVYSFLVISMILLFIRRQHQKLSYQQQVAEKERQISNDLRELHTLKDQFLANTSHELRTPLNGIIGLSEILSLEPEFEHSAESRESLLAINQCGNQLKVLVDELLDFSRLQNKRVVLNRTFFDINLLVEQIGLASHPQAAKQKLKLKLQLSNLPLMVFADENRISQVIYNLLNNAIKFSDHGQIIIAAVEEYEQVRISVSDQGIGIPINLQNKIFYSFTQIDGSSSRNRGGIGLGLAISKDIVELHGGKLKLFSVIGEGSEFSFKLPTQAPSVIPDNTIG